MLNIVIKNNYQVGGLKGYLANENNMPLELPSPFNVSAEQYCCKYSDAYDKIIKLCKIDGKIIFNCNEFNIIDLTK